MSPEAIGAGASMLRFVGDQVAADSADVVRTWSGIASHYDAPESSQLVSAMDPVKTSGDTFDTHLGSAADALVTFADEVRAIKHTLEGIRGEANALLATIDGNGKVGAAGPFPGSDWYHDPVTFHRNEALIAAVEAQAQALKAAERKCAGAIASLVQGGGRRGENGGPGFSSVTAPNVDAAPWGHVMTGQEANEQWEREAPGYERGASKQVMEGVAGLVALGGWDTSGFDPSSGLPHGKLFGDWSGRNIVTTLEGISRLLYDPRAWAAVAKDFAAIGDWDRPSYAIGEVAVNLAGVGLAFTKAGSFGRLGAAGRETVDAAGAGKVAAETAEASRLAKLAGAGQRLGARVTVPTVDGLKALSRAGAAGWARSLDHLDKVVHVLRHDIDVDKPSTPHPYEPRTHSEDSSSAGRDRRYDTNHDNEGQHPPQGEHSSATQHDGTPSDHSDGASNSDGQHPEADAVRPEVGTKENPAEYSYFNRAEALRDSTLPTPDDLDGIKAAKAYTPGTEDHMRAKWVEYQDLKRSTGKKAWSWERWHNKYIDNQGYDPRGKAFEEAYAKAKGLEAAGWERNALADTTDLVRNYDALQDMDALELKSGAHAVKEQIEKDTIMVNRGYSITYVFGEEPSAALVRRLEEAGINVEMFHAKVTVHS